MLGYNYLLMPQERRDNPLDGFISEGLVELTSSKPRRGGFIGQRQKWERGRVERIQRGKMRPVLVEPETDEYRDRLALDNLDGTERKWSIKYDGDGYLYVPIWETKTIIEEGGKRRLHNPQNIPYRVIWPKKTPPDYLKNIPEDKPGVSAIGFQQVDGIKKAKDQQKDILKFIYHKELDEGEIGLARRVVEFTEQIMYEFMLRGKVTKADTKRLAIKTAEFLGKEGLYDPRDPRKVRILRKLMDVMDKPGQEDPRNFLVIVSKIGAAHTAARERLATLAFYILKFEGFFQTLSFEDENSLWKFRLTDRQLEVVQRNYTLKRSGARGTDLQKKWLKKALEEMAEGTLVDIRVRPHIKLARWLKGILISGLDESDIEANSEILEIDKEIAREIVKRPSVYALISDGNFGDAAKRIKTARSGIKKSLARYEKTEAS